MFSAKYAVKTVSRRKKRNMLTILGLAIGVAMVASAQIATDTMIVSFTDLIFSEIGEVDVIVGSKNETMFNQTVYDLLANDPRVQNEIAQNGITPRLGVDGLATDQETGQIETSVTIWGINDTLDTGFGKLIDTETGEELFVKDLGVTPLAINEAIIGRELANTLQTEKGKTIIIGFTNKNDQSVNFPLTITHIAKNTGKATWNGGNTIFLSLPTIRTLFGAAQNEINTIFVDTKPGEETSDKTVDAIENVLEDEGLLELFDVVPLRDAIEESVSEGFSDFETLLLVFGSFVIVSGIILIINIFLMNVEERKRSTGVLRAVGMKRSQVITSFLTEAIILGIIGAFIGILIGLLIGYLLAWYLTQTFSTLFGIEDFTITLVLEPSVIIVSVIAGIIIAIIAGVYPAIRASRVDVVETLKGIEKPKRKKAGKRSLILGIIL
ncbi:MAG: ABC transporter permease, partial [Candidatus Hodarchaeota archaeon]